MKPTEKIIFYLKHPKYLVGSSFREAVEQYKTIREHRRMHGRHPECPGCAARTGKLKADGANADEIHGDHSCAYREFGYHSSDYFFNCALVTEILQLAMKHPSYVNHKFEVESDRGNSIAAVWVDNDWLVISPSIYMGDCDIRWAHGARFTLIDALKVVEELRAANTTTLSLN